jgi:calmodulin
MMDISAQELQDNVDLFDTDNDGRIDLPEFTRLMQALDAAASGEELSISFQAIATNGSGQVEFSEFSGWFASR